MSRININKHSVNLGLAGQLNDDAVLEALMGFKFDVTQSCSDWGHGPAPSRFYLTCFAFLDTTKVPLIGPNSGTVTTLKRMKSLPVARETVLGKPIFDKNAVVSVWEPESTNDNSSLIAAIHHGLGYNTLRWMVDDAAEELLGRIESTIGDAILHRENESARHSAAIKAAMGSVEDKDTAVRAVARTRDLVRKAGKAIEDLDRLQDLWNRHLNKATRLPSNVSVIVVLVDPSQVETDEIPGYIKVASDSTPKVVVNNTTPAGKVATHLAAQVGVVPSVMAGMRVRVRGEKRKSKKSTTHSGFVVR